MRSMRMFKKTLIAFLVSVMTVSSASCYTVIAEETAEPTTDTSVEPTNVPNVENDESSTEKELTLNNTESLNNTGVEDDKPTSSDVPTVLNEISTYSLAPTTWMDYATASEEEIRNGINDYLAEAQTYNKLDYIDTVRKQYDEKIADAQNRLNDPAATKDTLSWGHYYMGNLIRDLKNETNKLTELGKQVYAEYDVMNETDSTKYTTDTWNAYVKACNDAMTTVRSYKQNDVKIQAALDNIILAKSGLKEVDQNLNHLKSLVIESEKVSYDNYTIQSWRAFQEAIYNAEQEIKKSSETIDGDLYITLRDDIWNTQKSLAKGTTGTEYGIREEYTKLSSYGDGSFNYERNAKIRGGILAVTSEKTNEDGTSTLTFSWENNGVNPLNNGMFHNIGLTWGDYTYRTISEREWNKSSEVWVKVHYVTESGESKTEEVKLAKEDWKGFTKEIAVPSGSVVDLTLTTWNNPYYVYSVGYYHTQKYEAPTPTPSEVPLNPSNDGGTGTWDDGGPFTTDVCGNVFDRWGNKIYSAPSCQVSDGYHVPNTGVR